MSSDGGQNEERALIRVVFLYAFIANGPATGVFLEPSMTWDFGW